MKLPIDVKLLVATFAGVEIVMQILFALAQPTPNDKTIDFLDMMMQNLEAQSLTLEHCCLTCVMKWK